MIDKDKLIYLVAGAGLTYAFVCYRDQQLHKQRKAMRARAGHGHPQQHGPMQTRRPAQLPPPQLPTPQPTPGRAQAPVQTQAPVMPPSVQVPAKASKSQEPECPFSTS